MISTSVGRGKWNPTPPGCRDERRLIRALTRHSECAHMESSPSLAIGYPEFLDFFAKPRTLTRHHLVIGASFTYAWMPTILDFRSTEFDRGVAVLRRARRNGAVSEADLQCLAEIVNNSVVGASKLLHFVAPDAFAIWDSRVASYLGSRIAGTARGVATYSSYNRCMVDLAGMPEAADIARTVSRRIHCRTRPLRALELVMYSAGVANMTYES